MMTVFFELAIIIGIATLVGLLMHYLKQPLIIGYILTGLLVGPYLFNVISGVETIEIFSKIGVALLLFVVGLHLNPKIIKEVGKVSLITGLGQVLFTSTFGFLIAKLLGFSTIVSLYTAIALTFSSTIIIMKLISDKGDANRLYGKISIGFLIVQDLVAVFILMIISSSANSANLSLDLLKTLGFGIVLVLIVFLIGYYLLPKFTKLIARSQELLLLFSISWALVLSAVFYLFNFSIEVGAFLAGMTISMSPYRHEISYKMRPIRDFFIVLFFIILGYQMGFASISEQIIPIIIFSLFVLIGNPLIVIVLMGILGYSKRNGFLAGITVAQISEFSLILIALGVTVGHLEQSVLSILTTVGLITMAGSSYMIVYADKLYPKVSKYLSVFEKKGKKVDDVSYNHNVKRDVVIFGYDRIGQDLLKYLKRNKNSFLIIDYNPLTIKKLLRRKIPCIYGDVTNMELLDDLDLKNTKIAISIISSYETNLMFVKKLKKINKDMIIIVTSKRVEDTFSLYKEGATHVIMPDLLGGEHIEYLINKFSFDKQKYLEEKFKHISSFENREELDYEEV